MIITNVNPLSAQSVLLCKPARMRVVFSVTAGFLSALAPLLIKETNCFPPVGVPTGIRAARARSQVYLLYHGLSGT